MCTDITVLLEYWQDSDGVRPWGSSQDPAAVAWSYRRVHSFSEGYFCVGRSYPLFGALAGVQSNLEPLYPPRGLPPLVSMAIAQTVRRPIYADDVSAEEVFGAMMSAMRTLESHLGAGRTRLVFWFD